MSADYLLEEGSHTPPAAWDDFLSGTAAGVALTLVGHPFDTVKVRLQTQPALYKSGIQCCTDTIRKEGFFALYKGMGGPMLTVPLVNAIVFFGYGQAKSAMQRSQPADRPLSLLQISAAGACAGLLNTIVVSPVELIKTRLQIQHEAVSLRAKLHLSSSAATGAMTARPVEGGEKRVFEGPVDCVRKIVRQNGIKGLFRGMSATAYREVPCYASQFFAYEALKRLLTPPGKTDNELGAPRLILAGGLAGITGWVFSYPQDFIKSQLQSEPYDQKTLFKKHPLLLDGGFLTCLKQTIRTEGWKALWRGFGTCAARAFPANAAGFCAYEWSLAMLRDKRKT